MLFYKKGGGIKRNKSKIAKVMREFKNRKLKSSSGRRVKSRKQAIAIALSKSRKRK